MIFKVLLDPFYYYSKIKLKISNIDRRWVIRMGWEIWMDNGGYRWKQEIWMRWLIWIKFGVGNWMRYQIRIAWGISYIISNVGLGTKSGDSFRNWVVTIPFTNYAEIYSTLTSKVQRKPSFSIYFKNLFDDKDIGWVEIYMPATCIT